MDSNQDDLQAGKSRGSSRGIKNAQNRRGSEMKQQELGPMSQSSQKYES